MCKLVTTGDKFCPGTRGSKSAKPTYPENQGWGAGGGGVLQISSDTDDRRIFLGLKFSIPGFLGVGKFGQCFSGWDFLAIFRIE